jgi:hypothetical protein
MMLTVLGGLPQFEREQLREQTGEDRRPKLIGHQRREAGFEKPNQMRHQYMILRWSTWMAANETVRLAAEGPRLNQRQTRLFGVSCPFDHFHRPPS